MTPRRTVAVCAVVLAICAAVTVWSVWTASDLDAGQPSPAGTTAPRPLP